MKRKRIQNNEDNNCTNNSDKKMRVAEEGDQNDENGELDNSFLKKEFVLTREIADNSILCDIAGSKWRIGAPVGKGSFGEIYLASNDISKPVDKNNAKYVTKIEPHSNGPLFVEIHCLLNVNKENVNENEESIEKRQEIIGIPKYIASGSHFFDDIRYRFLIMPRYKADLHSITKHGRLSQKHFLIIASRIIDVLQQLHEKFYVHSDIKAQNVMIGQYDTSINSLNNSNLNATHELKQPLLDGVMYNINSSNNYNHRKSSSKSSVQFGGSNPLRSCRMKEDSHDKSHHSMYNDMVRSHYLRPGRSVDYAMINDEVSRSSHYANDSETSDNSDEDFEIGPRRKIHRNSNKGKRDTKNLKSHLKNTQTSSVPTKIIEINNATDSDDHVHIIDYGLATKYVDTNGEHRPFCMDQRRAHDGTIEFTSRDAHFGAHSRRSDLECFGYNLIYWSQGYLPWKDEKLRDQPEIVHRLKEIFMTDVKEMLKLLYGKDVPKYLGEFMHYVGQLEFDEEPNYAYLQGLFEKEFFKLGFNDTDLKLNINEIRDECEPIDKSISEHDLMMKNITDLKTVTKLGFLVASTDSVDGAETLVKPKESISLNLSCKASPKNLRSKEKSSKGVKRPKRERKVLTEKEIVCEKMARGKKLSIHEIAILDPEQIARDRAEKEYEKFDEKVYYQTPQRYKGNPTYAILEIENRLKAKNGGSTPSASSTLNAAEVEPIKGYTKPMMDVLKKQQMIVEQQMVIEQTSPLSTYQKRNREGLRNVIKHTPKNITYQNEVNLRKEGKHTTPQKRRLRNIKSKVNRKLLDESEKDEALQQLSISKKTKRRGRPSKIKQTDNEQDTDEKVVKKRGRRPKTKQVDNEQLQNPEELYANVDREVTNDNSNNEATDEAAVERKRKIRSKSIKNSNKNEIVAQETEEDDSVYYDIPGEGSNDGINDANSDISGDEFDEEDIQPLQKRLRKRDISLDEENSNHSSVSSNLRNKRRGRYYNDEDFEVNSEEASNQSSITYATKSSSTSFKPSRRLQKNTNIIQETTGKITRNKTKSRSTSRSAAAAAAVIVNSDDEQSEGSEIDGSEFELDDSSSTNASEIEFEQELSDDDENENQTDDEENVNQTDSELDDDEDSIDIKYSPIKTRHARRRITYFNMKQIRGRRMNILNEDVRNFRLVSTRG